MKTQPKPLPTIKSILDEHVTLTVECLDRLYLNGYVPGLQTEAGLVGFLTRHLQFPVASPALLGQLTRGYVRRVEDFIQQQQIPVVHFKKGERKDKIARRMRRQHPVRDGVVFVGIAQEKAQAFKAAKGPPSERGYVQFQYSRQPVFVKHYYFHLDDAQFGEGFIKICTYAPYPIKVCLNGHEWAKRQLHQQGIAFEALDNGFWKCADPQRLQQTCDEPGPPHIQEFLQRWLQRLPFPLDPKDQHAAYAPHLSIWQMEYSLTQVFDRPVHGREFFEEVIRENLDLGRPDRVQLRQHVAALLGRDLADYRPAQMTYDLRRLRRKGFICRQAGSTRYELTPYGRYTSLFLVRLYQRVLRPGLAAALEPPSKVDVPHPLRDKIQELDAVLEQMLRNAHLQN